MNHWISKEKIVKGVKASLRGDWSLKKLSLYWDTNISICERDTQLRFVHIGRFIIPSCVGKE